MSGGVFLIQLVRRRRGRRRALPGSARSDARVPQRRLTRSTLALIRSVEPHLFHSFEHSLTLRDIHRPCPPIHPLASNSRLPSPSASPSALRALTL